MMSHVIDSNVSLAMSKGSLIDRQTECAVHLFLDRIGHQFDISGAWLFGSRARNTHDVDSDADVAVVLNGEPAKSLPTTLAMSDIAYDILLVTGVNITPLAIWVQQWEHPETHTNPELLKSIARDGVAFPVLTRPQKTSD